VFLLGSMVAAEVAVPGTAIVVQQPGIVVSPPVVCPVCTILCTRGTHCVCGVCVANTAACSNCGDSCKRGPKLMQTGICNVNLKCVAWTSKPPKCTRPGTCPAPVPGTLGSCLVACTGDSSCPNGDKCCSNGCGNQCMVANPPKVPPGSVCPIPDPSLPGPCYVSCTGDNVCPIGQKCCSNGCGKNCMAPIECTPLPCPFIPPSSCSPPNVLRKPKLSNGCPGCQQCLPPRSG